jgi:hypothetical protein
VTPISRIGVIAALITILAALPAAVLADDHTPALDIVPTAIWDTNATTATALGNPAVNGDIVIQGTATVPLLWHTAFSYDRIQNGSIHSGIGQVTDASGATLNPGSVRDTIGQYRLDYTNRGLGAEFGYFERHRICCPATASANNATPASQHVGFVQLSYATPPIKALGNAFISYAISGKEGRHDPTAAFLASVPPGLNNPRSELLGISHNVSAIIPIDEKSGFIMSASFLWGAFDFYDNAPFAYNYNIYVFGLNKRINKYLSFVGTVFNVKQRPQGSPFTYPNAVSITNVAVGLDVHIGK